MATSNGISYRYTYGTSKSEWLSGSNFYNDVIHGFGGNDYLFGYNGTDKLYGGSGRDYLSGGSGNDHLDGGTDNDRLYGGSGNDTLIGGQGADYLNGGSGSDTVSYETATSGVYVSFLTNKGSWGDAAGDTYSGIENVTASNHNDYVYGNNAANIIHGLDGRDTLRGYGGDDIIDGGEGNDTIWGGAQNDTLIAGTGFDTLYGEDGNDRFEVGDGLGNTLYGGDDTDTASYALSKYGIHSHGLDKVEQPGSPSPSAGVDILISVENLTGSNYADDIYGTDQRNVLHGLDGDDDINGGGGNDAIYGEDGDDTLNGGAGNDSIYGGDGDDIIIGGGSTTHDTLKGGAGNDVFIGGGDANRIYGDTGSDTVTYQFSSTGVEVDLDWWGSEKTGGGAEDDVLFNIENITGSNYDDELGGNFEANTLIGRAGDDIFEGSIGNDVIDGGADNDTLIFEDYMAVSLHMGSGNASVWIDNETYTELGADAQHWDQIVTNIENIHFGDLNDQATGDSTDNAFFGNRGADTFYGMHGNDHLEGGVGDDYLHGQQGDDTLIGGNGIDTLRGGWGNDTLYGWDTHRLFDIWNPSDSVSDGSTDTFIFDDPIFGPEEDHIINFASGEDKIDFSNHSAFNSFDDVMAATTEQALYYDGTGFQIEGLILDTNDGGAIHLDFVAVAGGTYGGSTTLSADDFIF